MIILHNGIHSLELHWMIMHYRAFIIRNIYFYMCILCAYYWLKYYWIGRCTYVYYRTKITSRKPVTMCTAIKVAAKTAIIVQLLLSCFIIFGRYIFWLTRSRKTMPILINKNVDYYSNITFIEIMMNYQSLIAILCVTSVCYRRTIEVQYFDAFLLIRASLSMDDN